MSYYKMIGGTMRRQVIPSHRKEKVDLGMKPGERSKPGKILQMILLTKIRQRFV